MLLDTILYIGALPSEKNNVLIRRKGCLKCKEG